jgi:hypothetical protein
MNINTTSAAANHAKSIINELRTSNELPFTGVLSADTVDEHIRDIPHRDRFFSPDILITNELLANYMR